MPVEKIDSSSSRPDPAKGPKVLFVIGHLSLGGAETQLYHLACGLRRRGFEPVIVTLLPGGEVRRQMECEGFSIHTLKTQGTSRYVRRVPELASILRRVKPDIIHAKLMDANIWGGLSGIVCGHRRMVFTELGPGTRLTKRVRLFREVISRFGAATVCNSELVARKLDKRWPSRTRVVVHNGIHDRWFSDEPSKADARASLDLDPDAFVVATVSHYTYSKNLELFFQAGQKLSEHAKKAYFVVAGEGPRRKRCEHLVCKLGIESQVRLLGEISDPKVLLQAADAFVLSSRSEGLPNALMEAMASGVPCVSTDVGGCRELIPSAQQGHVVPSEDVEGIVRCLQAIHDDPQHARDVAAAGRRYMREHFDLEAMIDRTVAVYESLLGKRAAHATETQRA